MTLADLESLLTAVAPALRSRVPVLFSVPDVAALPLEAGDKLPITADFDADGSFVIAIDTSNALCSRPSRDEPLG